MDLSMPKADIIKVPTVHRLDLAQIIASYPSEWRALDNGCLLERIQLLLKRVVDLYNTRINHKPRYYRFKELSMNQQLCNGVENHQFRIWCVHRQLLYSGTSLSPFLKAVGAKGNFSNSTSEVVLFFYRTTGDKSGEVFAIADGVTAWHLFAAYRDSTFARLIAKRMLAKPISRLRTRPLVGHKTQTESTHDGLYHWQETKQGLAWIEGLKARVKADSLPSTLLRLRQNPPELSMQERALKFHCSFAVEEWFALLDHLSHLQHTAPTDEESLEFAFLTSLQPADFTLVPALEEALCREVWRVFSAKDRIETALRFAPHKNEDYHQAVAYAMSKIKTPSASDTAVSKVWTLHLTTNELIHKLASKESFKKISNQLRKTNSKESNQKLADDFVEKVKEVRLYYLKNNKCLSCSFIKCFQGEVFLSRTSEHFFQVKGQWLKPRLDFFAALHRDFGDLLVRSLIRPGHYFSGHLPQPWVGRTSKEKGAREDVEGKYNLSYLKLPGYIVGDKACPHSVEMFDILFYDEDHEILYLHQVKETFGGGARAAAFQLMSAADAIFAIRHGDATWLELFSKGLESKNKEAYTHFIHWGGVEKLRHLIQSTLSKNIVFVYALAESTSNARELSDELQLVRRLCKSDFDDWVNASEGVHTAEELLDYLRIELFIDAEGRVTTQGLSCFEIGEKDRFFRGLAKHISDVDLKSLYAYLKGLVASKFNSSIPRFTMIKAARHIENKGFTFAIDGV